ncbi:MAG: hypothetical protein ACR2JM_04810 [Mycobacterium sp.]
MADDPKQQVEPVPETTPEGSAEPSATPASSVLPPVIPTLPDAGYTPSGVPTLDGVRDKIETRYGTALGATELAEETPEGRTAADQFAARQKAAADKLEEIRSSMHEKD